MMSAISLTVVMLSVVMFNDIMQSVIRPIVILLNVVAPEKQNQNNRKEKNKDSFFVF